jgi:cytidylate kinase
MHRENSPLKQADDAVLLDSSDMTLKEVVDTITAMIDKKQGA